MPTVISATARRLLAAVALAALFGGPPLDAQSFDPAKDSPLTLFAAPTDPVAYLERRNQAFTLVNARNWAAAEPLLDQLTRDYPRDGVNWMVLGNTRSHLGKSKEAAAAYERAGPILGWGFGYDLAGTTAAQHLAAGDRARALAMLRQEVFDSHSVMRQQIYDLPDFASLRNDPEFRRITGHPDTTGWASDEGWRHDVDYLYEELTRTSPDYRDRPLPAEVTRRYKELRRQVPRLSNAQIYIGMSRMLAPMRAGHTSLFQPTGSRYLPLRDAARSRLGSGDERLRGVRHAQQGLLLGGAAAAAPDAVAAGHGAVHVLGQAAGAAAQPRQTPTPRASLDDAARPGADLVRRGPPSTVSCRTCAPTRYRT